MYYYYSDCICDVDWLLSQQGGRCRGMCVYCYSLSLIKFFCTCVHAQLSMYAHFQEERRDCLRNRTKYSP